MHAVVSKSAICGVIYAIHDGQLSGATYADTHSAPKEVTWCTKMISSCRSVATHLTPLKLTLMPYDLHVIEGSQVDGLSIKLPSSLIHVLKVNIPGLFFLHSSIHVWQW